MSVREAAETLGRTLGHLPPERRLEGLAARIEKADGRSDRGRFFWRMEDGLLVGHVSVGRRGRWALGTRRTADPSVAKDLVLTSMTVSLVHEATGCTCAGGPCPAFMAFERATRSAAA